MVSVGRAADVEARSVVSTASAAKVVRISMLGVPLHRILPTERAQLNGLALTVLVASISFAALQERVLYVPGFRYTGWMAIVTSVTYVACACAEQFAVGEAPRLGPMSDYTRLSILTMGGMYLTNWSLRYLSYPLRVVFKSSKLIPVMVLSVVYLKKRYSLSQYVSVGLLTAGVVVFTLGDAKGKASFDARGIALILFGSFLEALAANFEELRLFNQRGCPASEVLLYSNLVGCAWAVAADALKGDLLPSVRHSADHPEAVLLIALAALAGYVASSGVLVLIKHFGATVAEIVKSCRKIMTICISFLLYGKPWTLLHVAGGILFVASVAVERAAAGGASRRFAGLLLSCSMLAAVLLQSSARGPSTFSVVIDAGSTGTRVNIFRFDSWTSQIRDIGGAAQVWVALEPGIGALVRNESGLRALLRPLLDVAVATVPPAQRAATPLALRATSLELLPEWDAQWLLAEARAILEPYGFEDAGVRLMDGREQGECQWLTVNFLSGTFRPGVQAISDPAAVVELGGDSLQMAYLMTDADAERAKTMRRGGYVRKLALPFGSGFVRIYRYSYVGHGLMTARVKILDAHQGAGRPEAGHPCLPAGARVVWHYDGRAFSVVGAGDPAGCARLVVGVLQPGAVCGNGSLEWGNCTFGGAWGGVGSESQRLVLSSFFFDRLADAGAVRPGERRSEATPESYVRAAGRACEAATAGPAAAAAAFPAGTGVAPWLCLDLSYLAALLEKGLRLEPGRRMEVVKQMVYDGRSFEASWALGMSIKSRRVMGR